MISVRDLEIFVSTAQSGSLSAAARLLDLTPAAASASLKRLEEHLGVRLFVRSTRSQRLSHEGEVYLQNCQQALQLLADGQRALLAGHAVVRGPLQLSMPSDLGRNLLLPWLDEFLVRHPDLQLRLQVSDRLADIFRQPVDIALRYGVPPDSRLIAIPLAAGNRRVLCASPAYLARHGEPASPAELVNHNCLCFMLGEYVHDRWRFFRDGVESSVQVRGNRLGDDGDTVRRWALAGQGVAYKSQLDICHELHDGRLVSICRAWEGERAPLNLICADRRQLDPAVQLLRQFLLERLSELPAAEGKA
jgi:DNA-binding transcriptional LysR family regulator